MEHAVLVADESIAGHVPTVAHVLRLSRIGGSAAAGGPAHGEVANGAVCDLLHAVVDDFGLVARHWPAGRARRGVAEPVGDEDVQEFGGADAVEDGFAGLLGPLPEHG